MTSPVAPDEAPPVPEFPALGDPAFNSKAYSWATAIPALVTWISGAIAKAYQNALSAFESATASASNAAAAEASSLASAGSANFRGDWTALTGPLNRPASVAHAGRTWRLLQDLADVTSATPADGSAYWRAYDVVLPVVHVTTATYTAVAGYEYSLEYMGGPVTLTLPPSPSEGALLMVTVANGRYDNVIARNGSTIMGDAQDVTFDLITSRSMRFLNASWRGL